MEELINKIIKEKQTPGLALLVGNKKGIILERCYGKTEYISKREDVNKYTLYDLASLTKVIGTTMAILKMIEKGKISIFDRISYFYKAADDKGEITIKNLLTHTSGLKAGIKLYEIANDYHDAIKIILNEPLECNKNEKVIYSDLGFILLGDIIEKVMDKKLNEVIDELVLSPLEMKYTTFNPKENINIAATEKIGESNKFYKGIVHDENARFFGGVSGNAGLFSNIYDLNNFGNMLVNKGKFKGKRFINENLYRLMTSNFTSNLNEGRGLGWAIYDLSESSSGEVISKGAFGHTGFTGTSIWVDPYKEVYVIILSNRIHPTREDLRFIRTRRLINNCIFSNI